MAQYLYRLGRFAARRRRTVLLVWLAALVLAVVGATTLSGTTDDSFSIPGTESQTALDLLEEQMPGAGGASARAVFAAPEGTTLTDPTAQEAIAGSIAALEGAPSVLAVSDPFTTGSVSADQTIAYATANYAEPAEDLSEAATDALLAAAEPARDAGLQVEFGGDALGTPEHSSSSEVIGIAVAILVLLITFGSLIAAGLPILTAVFGVGVGISLITAATGFFTMSATAPTLAIMLGLAVGIDYALFIVSRHPPAARRRPGRRGGDRPGDRDLRQRRRVRRAHRRHRARRPHRRRHPVPHRDGALRGGHGHRRRVDRHHVAACPARLRRRLDRPVQGARPQGPQGPRLRQGCARPALGSARQPTTRCPCSSPWSQASCCSPCRRPASRWGCRATVRSPPTTTERRAYDLLAEGHRRRLQRSAHRGGRRPRQRRPPGGGRRGRTAPRRARRRGGGQPARRSARPATSACSPSSRPRRRHRPRPWTWCTPSATPAAGPTTSTCPSPAPPPWASTSPRSSRARCPPT